MTDMPIFCTCYSGQISGHLGKCYGEEFESLCLKKKRWNLIEKVQGIKERQIEGTTFESSFTLKSDKWKSCPACHASKKNVFSILPFRLRKAPRTHWVRHLGPVGILGKLHIVTQTILLSFVPSIYSHSKSVFRALMFLFRRITYVVQDLTVGQGEAMQTLNWYEGLCLAAHIWVKPRMKQ